MITKKNLPSTSALRFVILLGIVSLFSDTVYEGSRSVIGPLFETLGATGAIVGFIAGFGELAGNVLRIFSGRFVDRTKKYWLTTFLGYSCIFAIPFLSFVHSWEMAAVLIIIERIGKAIRTPARDAMLSYATQKMGRGFGFGLHQLLDQIGGMLGPFLMTLILFTHHSYSHGFSYLFIPAIITLLVLALGEKQYPHPGNLEIVTPQLIPESDPKKIPTAFWIYLVAACLMAAGYSDFPLIAFHFEKIHLLKPVEIPIFYMVALAISGGSAILFGWIYDKKGGISLISAIIFSAFFSPCVFLGGFYTAIFGMILWGIGLGAQKSLLKAIVGDMTSKNMRGTAFGIFNAGYGIAWFLGSWLMGVLYDTSVHELIAFSIAAQLLAIPLLITISKNVNHQTKKPA